MKKLVILMVAVVGVNLFASQNEERALIAYMRVVPGTESQFLKAARAVIEESREETGNIRYQLHQSTVNP
ncbi:MAG: antibiotic biosynthesis monooxygenase [Deltaproteobacteria bacterium]|nr:antibiotic biosynthesis monooxygenase [Deltaproteobacteria bacterium]MBI3294373.1 antibiotic biosynthesis monooxygenase [Deltaproteobacteria bacterium]